ncbi:MAG TPA: ABC transporter ATP-binding protein [Geminicoccus sp.]|uniref:ABC transporter ATP-binding protein n=1 Tax=Geminicoccus sp. TaxID=2024832 RepID=UPI002BB976EE|nr:ABC transporter ATP-binding protein [Geminicoccus sp.]HWL71766.1 ABC transporter ATP-binding protein [Geminicoccus sp.]
MSLLKVRELAVQYGAVAALQGVSIDVSPGEVVALIGPNGAGKTSLLSAVAGVVRPRAGTIGFDGQDLAGMPIQKIVRAGIALVPENRDIFTKLTVMENLLIGASTRGDRQGIAQDIERIGQLFPALPRLFPRPAGLLSGGEQQMLAIGRALMSRPRLLMLDEPSLGLAPVVTDAVFAGIRTLRAEGMAILLVEQNAVRALSVCDRAHLLSAGIVHFTGTPDEIAHAGDIDAAYFGVPSDVAAQGSA